MVKRIGCFQRQITSKFRPPVPELVSRQTPVTQRPFFLFNQNKPLQPMTKCHRKVHYTSSREQNQYREIPASKLEIWWEPETKNCLIFACYFLPLTVMKKNTHKKKTPKQSSNRMALAKIFAQSITQQKLDFQSFPAQQQPNKNNMKKN